MLYAEVPSYHEIKELYMIGLESLQNGGFSERFVEKARKDKSKAEWAKKTGTKMSTLDKLGVSSTFFKSATDEENFTNHAPSPPSEVPSLYIT